MAGAKSEPGFEAVGMAVGVRLSPTVCLDFIETFLCRKRRKEYLISSHITSHRSVSSFPPSLRLWRFEWHNASKLGLMHTLCTFF